MKTEQDRLTERDSIDGFVERVIPMFPTLDPEIEGAVDRLHKIHKHIERELASSVSTWGLNVGEFHLLTKLRTSERDEITAGELADKLDLSTGAMTNRLDGLEERGLIARRRGTEDRRSMLVSITPEGIELLGKAIADQASKENQILGALSPAEHVELNALLRRMILSIEAKGGPPVDHC